MKWVENLWWNQNIPPLLWRWAIIQHSVSWRWIGREVSIHKFQVIFACAESWDLPKTKWAVLWLSSFSIFPKRRHDVQLWMSHLQQQFLRSQHDRWVRFPCEKHNWPPTAKYKNGQVLLSSSFQLCTNVSFQDYYPQHTCSFSLNLEAIWRRPRSRKENSIQKWRKLEGIQYTPRTSQIISSTVQFIVYCYSP